MNNQTGLSVPARTPSKRSKRRGAAVLQAVRAAIKYKISGVQRFLFDSHRRRDGGSSGGQLQRANIYAGQAFGGMMYFSSFVALFYSSTGTKSRKKRIMDRKNSKYEAFSVADILNTKDEKENQIKNGSTNVGVWRLNTRELCVSCGSLK